LKYGNENLLNDFTSSNQEENGGKDSDFNDRQDSGKENESFMAIQARIKEKYGLSK
jgi:hypothetical protein